MGIQAVPTAPRSPWQNAYVERVIWSIRREWPRSHDCGERGGLHRVLTDDTAYYMRSRTHLALGKDAPIRARSCVTPYARAMSLCRRGPRSAWVGQSPLGKDVAAPRALNARRSASVSTVRQPHPLDPVGMRMRPTTAHVNYWNRDCAAARPAIEKLAAILKDHPLGCGGHDRAATLHTA
jgi:hypothetical protein